MSSRLFLLALVAVLATVANAFSVRHAGAEVKQGLESLDAFTRQRVADAVAARQRQPPAAAATQPNYGSYVCLCDSASNNVTFVNFPERDCLGEASLYTLPLNQCFVEFQVDSWNGFCNNTNMWYNNFASTTTCAGTSALTRMYETYKCFNCPNKECKNG